MAEPFEIPLPNIPSEVQRVLRTGITIVTPVQIGIPGQPLLLLEHARIHAVYRKIIKRRHPVKVGPVKTGSVKEYWTADDIYITISGSLKDYEVEGYPMSKVSQLHNIARYKRDIRIECEKMYALGVSRIAIEDMELPPEKGGWVDYTIRAYSDQDWDLLVK